MKKYKYWNNKENVIEESRKYATRTEFFKKSKGAYAAAVKHGWLEEMTWLTSVRRARWTKEAAIEESTKYSTLHDFIKGSVGAYQASLKHGWLEEMPWLKCERRNWTRESVIEESKKYSSRTEFARSAVGAYLFAKNNGMLDSMIWLPMKIHSKWTREECVEESKKYSTRKEFSECSSGAYTAAFDNGWIYDMPWLEVLTRPAWTKEECLEESRKYASKREFQDGSAGAYEASRKNGWLAEMPWLKPPVLGELKQLPNHCVYVYEDVINLACYVGRTNRLRKRDHEHRHPYNKEKPDSLKRYFDSIGLDIPLPVVLKDNLLPTESQYWEDYYLHEYHQKGYHIINRGKTGINVGSLGGGFIKWDRNTTLDESRKYKTFGEFAQSNASAYQAARRYGWIDEMTWLEYEQMPNDYWTKERVIEESKKYSSRTEMESGSPAAYSAALKNGWSSDLPLQYKRVGKDYYTKDKIRELSAECTKRSEFKRKYSLAYVLARENKWLDEFFPKSE